MATYDFMFKVIIIGDSGVGKTSIINRYVKKSFNDSTKPTIGVELNTKLVEMEEMQNKLQIWDTAGQERFRGVASSYYKGASGVLLVYDITKSETFNNLETWLKEVENNATFNVVKVIVGNKKDLQESREVLIEDATRFAKKNRCSIMEVTAKDDEKEIDQAFNLMIEQMLDVGGKTQQVKPGEEKPCYVEVKKAAVEAKRIEVEEEKQRKEDKKNGIDPDAPKKVKKKCAC